MKTSIRVKCATEQTNISFFLIMITSYVDFAF